MTRRGGCRRHGGHTSERTHSALRTVCGEVVAQGGEGELAILGPEGRRYRVEATSEAAEMAACVGLKVWAEGIAYTDERGEWTIRIETFEIIDEGR